MIHVASRMIEVAILIVSSVLYINSEMKCRAEHIKNGQDSFLLLQMRYHESFFVLGAIVRQILPFFSIYPSVMTSQI